MIYHLENLYRKMNYIISNILFFNQSFQFLVLEQNFFSYLLLPHSYFFVSILKLLLLRLSRRKKDFRRSPSSLLQRISQCPELRHCFYVIFCRPLLKPLFFFRFIWICDESFNKLRQLTSKRPVQI